MSRIFALIIVLTGCISYSQNAVKPIQMATTNMSANKEMLDLMRFNEVDYYQVKFNGEGLKGKYYSITIKEIWNGKVKNTDTIFNSAKKEFAFVGKLSTDTINFRIMTAKLNRKKLKISLYFDRFEINREYSSTSENSYSLRDVGTQLSIQPGNPFYAFAYILPHKLPNGGSSWCAIDSSGKDIDSWGKEFGIKHYLIMEMNFFDSY